jgi:hypothetical protein
MTDITTMTTAVTHQIYSTGRKLAGSERVDESALADRGAVSLEQVLWFVAAGVSVAVIAAILWGQIKDKADDPIISPSAP